MCREDCPSRLLLLIWESTSQEAALLAQETDALHCSCPASRENVGYEASMGITSSHKIQCDGSLPRLA